MTHYDVALIGTGSGNSVITEEFADLRVAIVEEHLFGGTCLNVGCIPTKMYVYPADVALSARHSQHLGLSTSYDGADWVAIRDRVFGRIDPIEQSGRNYRQGLPYVDVHASHGTFVDDHTIEVADGQITADQIVVAAGSRVEVAPIPGLDEVSFHTSDTVMRLESLPRRMTIVGGGFVSAELAHVFSSLGTDVTVVHRGDQLLQGEDEEVSAAFTRAATQAWQVRLSTLVTSVRPGPGEATQVATLSDGSELESDVLLLATGRTSNADRLGLEHTGIEVEDGVIVVDEHQRTSVEHVWALGDCANTHMLKHVANAEARVVRHNLLHADALRSSDHRFVPSAVFSHPQVASVGLTSQAAREQGIEHRSVTHDYADTAYGWAMESPAGEQFVKLIGDARGERLLGAHLVGPQASNLIQPLVQGLSLGAGVEELARGQYWIHPAMAEVVENALLKLIG